MSGLLFGPQMENSITLRKWREGKEEGGRDSRLFTCVIERLIIQRGTQEDKWDKEDCSRNGELEMK